MFNVGFPEQSFEVTRGQMFFGLPICFVIAVIVLLGPEETIFGTVLPFLANGGFLLFAGHFPHFEQTFWRVVATVWWLKYIWSMVAPHLQRLFKSGCNRSAFRLTEAQCWFKKIVGKHCLRWQPCDDAVCPKNVVQYRAACRALWGAQVAQDHCHQR